MRILLAEDEKSLSDALVAILKRFNYAADAVYNGEDAVDYALGGVYDLIILDIMMPKKDGITALKEIRAKGINTPVLMLTAKSELDDKVSGLDAGADDYLTKPFETKELLARIRAVTRRKTEIVSENLSFGDITLNKDTCELRCGSRFVALTAKEYLLMETLIENSSRVLSQNSILDKVWGYDGEVDGGVVWAYLSYLRKKLKSIGSTISVKSVRNVGYRLQI